MIKLGLLIITHRQLEVALRVLCVVVGEIFSPTWRLFHKVMEPYIDIKTALLSNANMLVEVLNFHAKLEAAPQRVLLYELIPQLLLCIVVSLAYLYLCNLVGLYAARLMSVLLPRPVAAE